MALALPSECIVYPIRYTMHVNAEGSERDRKSASLLDEMCIRDRRETSDGTERRGMGSAVEPQPTRPLPAGL